MRTMLESMVVAFAMYSKIPMPRIEWNENNMKYCMCFFPLIGIPIGLLALLWSMFCDARGYGILLRSCVLAVIPLAVSGGIHMDGLLDTADAIGSYKSMEQRLEIMKDSHSGAFAIIAGIACYTLYVGFLSEAEGSDIALIACSFVISRALSGLAVVTFRKARNSGLLRTFSDAAVNRTVMYVMLLYIAVMSVICIVIDPGKGAAMVLLSLAVFWWYHNMSYRKFGGTTGDVAGWFVQTVELVMAAGVALL